MKSSTRKSFLTSASALTLGIVFYVGTTPAIADIYSTYADPPNDYDLSSEVCMADAWMQVTGRSLPHDEINCTANDVEITQVIPRDASGRLPDDPLYEPLECTPGQDFSFMADVHVKTNANERYNPTFYVPLTEISPQYVQGPEENCSVLLPIPNHEGNPLWPGGDPLAGEIADIDLDGDQCGDISKAFGPDEYTLANEPITMYCTPSPDDPTRAEFNYCAAWSVDADGGCTPDHDPIPGIVPSQKSKCKCDSWPIDVFIKPNPPIITKTLVGTNTHDEFGGVYTFDLSFTNPSDAAALYLQSLSDKVDITTSAGDWQVSLDLWADPVVTVPAADGVYLTASNCEEPGPGKTSVEILPSGTYSCQFSIHIVDGTLPGLTASEIYDDAVKALLWDKNDDPVIDGDSCSSIGLPQAPGEHCSNIQTVYVTNVMPDIAVTKTANPNSLVEPGGSVTYTVVVTNNSAIEDLTLTSLIDAPFGDLNGWGTCSVPQTITPNGGTYTCSFDYEFVGLNTGENQTDTVTATGEDNEGNPDSAFAPATVWLTDSPASIELIKSADKTVINEPGEWVTYNFTVSNLSAVDTVWIDTLTDSIYGDLTVAPTGGWTTCGDGFDFEIAPSGTPYYCEYYVFVEADAAADPAYTYNMATAEGYDDDPIPNRLSDEDDHTIAYNDVPPAASLTKQVTQMIVTYKVRVTNESTAEQLFVDDLTDNTFGDITYVHDDILTTTCTASGQAIAIGGFYECQFDAVVDSSPHQDTVTGTVSDNDSNSVTPSGSATVTFGSP